jgi:hypothetical protein
MVSAPLRGFVSGFTAILMAAVFMVWLIACTNAANLMLARVTRRREIECERRSALHGPLDSPTLTESVLLGGGGSRIADDKMVSAGVD